MSHIFDIKSLTKLDNPERRQQLPPDKILHLFGLKQGDVVADVGCGTGYFTFPASGIVGCTGKVTAMDISRDMLGHVREKMNQSGTENIDTIQITGSNLLLADASVDVGLCFFVLHEAEEQHRFLRELNRIVKPGGKLALIEWDKRQMPQGPPVEHRVGREEACLLLTQTGFTVRNVEIGPCFYGLLGVKS